MAFNTLAAALDLGKLFSSCPIIYTILFLLIFAATAIWIYSLYTLKIDEIMPKLFQEEIKFKLLNKEYNEAFEMCQKGHTITSEILASGLSVRNHGHQVILNTIQSEGRRASNYLWQRISLLNDIALLAPMVGLLGTVLGLFWELYETPINPENIYPIFDHLGIFIGTTVFGLIVAITAIVYQTSLKYRVIHVLNIVENESLALANLIDSK